MLQELECIQFQRITLRIYCKKCLLGEFLCEIAEEKCRVTMLPAEYYIWNTLIR